MMGTTAAGTTLGSSPVWGHTALPAGSLGWAQCPRISRARGSLEGCKFKGSAREQHVEGATGCPEVSQQPQRGWMAPCSSCPEVTSLKFDCFGSESSQLHGFGGCRGGEGALWTW